MVVGDQITVFFFFDCRTVVVKFSEVSEERTASIFRFLPGFEPPDLPAHIVVTIPTTLSRLMSKQNIKKFHLELCKFSQS